MSRVSVLIPHHKNPKLLTPLLKSLREMFMDEATMQTVIVDNGSNDGSTNLVRRKFPEVKVYPLGSNMGFAPALNKAAKAFDSEWLCFLNNDVRVDPDWLSNLLYAAGKMKTVCLSSHLLNWEGTQTQFAGGWVNIFGKGFESDLLQDEKPYPVFFPCGGAMLIKRDVFLEMGGFDDDYFMIYEDIDLGWRLWLLGYSVYLVPDAYVMHKGHASLKNESYTAKAIYYERNSLATIYKNLDEDSLRFVLPLALKEVILRAKAVGGIGVPVRYSNAGTATLAGLNAFFQLLPKLRTKRKTVQSRRMLSDAEIFSRFFPHPSTLWAYCEEHYNKLYYPPIHTEITDLYHQAQKLLKLL